MRIHPLSSITFTLFLGCLLQSPISGASQPAVNTEAPHATVLVELFTSEGCSSCPPADTLLRQINRKQTAYGQLVLGISEHVTYWNGLGWSDPYSSEALTARQNAYGARFGLDSVYTPQMVINGREQIVGSDAGALQRAFEAESHQKTIDLHILSDKISGQELVVHFSVHQVPTNHALEIMVVLTDDADRSNVPSGENSGRVLQHVAVARALMRVATIHEDGDQTVHIALPASLAAMQSVGHHLIVFAQSSQFGPVLGADTKPL